MDRRCDFASGVISPFLASGVTSHHDLPTPFLAAMRGTQSHRSGRNHRRRRPEAATLCCCASVIVVAKPFRAPPARVSRSHPIPSKSMEEM